MPLLDSNIRNELQDSSSLGDNFLLEASAGTGKTTTLIGRVLTLVKSGVPITEIAIITYTKNAAAELRYRIRRELTAEIEKTPQKNEKEKLQTALLGLDRARIDTIHSFCKKILDEFPTEAGLPHRFSVLDETQEKTEFNKRWKTDFIQNLESAWLNDDYRLAILLAQTLDIDFNIGGNLYRTALKAEQHWNALPNASAIVSPTGYWNYLGKQLKLDVLEIIYNEGGAIFTGTNQKPQFDAFKKEFGALKSNFDSLDSFTKILEFARLINLVPSTTRKNDYIELFEDAKDVLVSYILNFLLAELCEFTIRGAEERARRGQATYQDLLIRVREVLRDSKTGDKIRSLLYSRFRQILIDEFQDTDPLQYEMAKLITTKPQDSNSRDGSLFLVGDEKQSIYHFRGADSKAFQSVRNEGHIAKRELLINFRTIQPIIEFINNIFSEEPLFGNDYLRLEPYRRGTLPDGFGPPVYLPMKSYPLVNSIAGLRELEAKCIAESIIWMLDENDGWKVFDKDAESYRPARLSDICILVRAKTDIHIFTSALDTHKIPYHLESGGFIFQNPEIQNLLNILRAIENPKDELSLVRSLRSPLFGCSDNDLYDFQKEHSSNWSYLAETCKKCSDPENIIHQALAWFQALQQKSAALTASQTLELIISERLALEISRHQHSQSSFQSIADTLDLFANKVRGFSQNSDGSLGELLSWLDTQIAAESRWALPQASDLIPSVRIMTMHSSKGLEFPIVILANLPARSMGKSHSDLAIDSSGELFFSLGKGLSPPSYPSKGNFINDYQEKETKEEIEEQKRLLYVACTRARDHLVITTPPPKPPKKPPKNGPEYKTPLQQIWGAIELAYKTNPTGSPLSEYRGLENLPESLPASVLEQKPVNLPDFNAWEEERIETLNQARTKGVRSATDIQRTARLVLENGKPLETAEESEGETESTAESTAESALEGQIYAGAQIRNIWKDKGLDIGNAIHYTMKDLDFRLQGDGQQEEVQKLASRYAEEYGILNPEKISKTCQHILNSSPIARALELSRNGRAKEDNAKSGKRENMRGNKAIIKKEIRFQTQLPEDRRFDGFVDLLIYDPEIDEQGKERKNGYTILDYKYSNKLDDKVLDERMENYKFQGASYALALMHILKKLDERSNPVNIQDLPDVVFIFANEKGVKERRLEPKILLETTQQILSEDFLKTA